MQGASKIFFYEGFRKRALRFLPRTPGCENSTAKAPLFWLIKSATIPLFCLEKFRSRALPQFLPTLSLATNETKMCARIRAHEVVKDFFSHRFRDFMCATFSSRRVVLFSLMMMRKERTVICTKCIEGRTNQEILFFPQNSKTLNICAFETPP